MKQNIILAFILLITLSIVNAFPHHQQLHKRATTFVSCPSGSQFPLTVTIQPDPPVAAGTEMFTISGTPTSDIPAGTIFAFQLLDDTGTAQGAPVTADFCSGGITCPVATGSAFSAIMQLVMPDTLPATYSFLVELTDGTTIFSCALGTVTGA